MDVFLFLEILLLVASRAQNGVHPVPPRPMQRSSSKLGQLCHSASSLKSLQRPVLVSRPADLPYSYDTGPSKNDEVLESLRDFMEKTTRSRVQDERIVMRKGGTGVLDRAANWAYAKPIRKRRVPPQGVPQESMEKILRVSRDLLDDEIFNTELGDQILPKGSFLEVRR